MNHREDPLHKLVHVENLLQVLFTLLGDFENTQPQEVVSRKHGEGNELTLGKGHVTGSAQYEQQMLSRLPVCLTTKSAKLYSTAVMPGPGHG